MKTRAHAKSSTETGRAILFLSLATFMFSGMPAAVAQSRDFNRFGLNLGVFITNRDTKTRLDGENPGSGTDVDLEADLGFRKSDSVFRFDGYFRFNERHRIDFSVFDLSRTASKRIQKDIEWDGTLYPIDVTVDANLDLSIYKLAYPWSFMQRENAYLGLTAGLYVADTSTRLVAESISAESSGGVTAPLPVIGLRGQYDFSEKWSFRGSAEVFSVEVNDYSGSLYDVYAGIDYQLLDHMAIGLGFNSVKLNVGVDKPRFSGDLDWQYDGGLLFLNFEF
jgi:hypothetical protein